MPRQTESRALPDQAGASQDSPVPTQPHLSTPDPTAPLTDWAQINSSLFHGIDLDDREAVNVRGRELFDQYKATRLTHPEKIIRSGFNSTLHNAIGHAAREAKREASAKQRVAEKAIVKEGKGKLRQHIKATAKAKANASLLTDAVLAQLTDLGVDLSPLEALTEGDKA